MEILINELSLDGSFRNLEEFYDSLRSVLKIQKLMEKSNASFLKHQELYTFKVTKELNLHDAFRDRRTRTNNEIRRFKQLLNSLMSDPSFWHEDQRHNSKDQYLCEFTSNTSGYSLAEACERSKIVMSFSNARFAKEILEVNKNGCTFDLINIQNFTTFSELLYEENVIGARVYCNHRFEGTNLSFAYLEEGYDFSILEESEEKAFISTFKMFNEMNWDAIMRSDGLDFKKYQPAKKDNWFLGTPYSSKQIYKFRTSQKFRCFGYREGDTFIVLRFETDHSISDNG
ncbi:hypothetical protein [Jeotgalibacillus salarius]|uniref:Uncharacterized protein n=1 Tax=Jeotgalibacillus salarius TaxID=546023 RepID=A0A4Y8LQU9_9BACL|nr:hypothetical protein [Jeotgalibacillus salarius]TFE03849.1 hypothetical protein E2626_00545 [Jeotgalibacillus salarius]